jgi:hypothetical protein
MQDVYDKLQELASERKCCLTVLAASGALSAATLTQASEAQLAASAGDVRLVLSFTMQFVSRLRERDLSVSIKRLAQTGLSVMKAAALPGWHHNQTQGLPSQVKA